MTLGKHVGPEKPFSSSELILHYVV
jgi:hypothetical protein